MKQSHSSIGERGSSFAFRIISALLALVVEAGRISWLTDSLLSGIGLLLIIWFFITLVLSLSPLADQHPSASSGQALAFLSARKLGLTVGRRQVNERP